MKRLSLIVLVGLVITLSYFVWAETITLTTYYPAPYGVYKVMRLHPSDRTTVTPCTEGDLFYDDGTGPDPAGVNYCDGTGTWQATGVPSGFCIFSDTQSSCPAGWTRRDTFDGRTIRGASSPGGTGGADTHVHATGSHTLTIAEMPSHSHTYYRRVAAGYPNPGIGSEEYRVQEVAQATSSTGDGNAHNHGDTDSASSWPPYRNVIICCKD